MPIDQDVVVDVRSHRDPLGGLEASARQGAELVTLELLKQLTPTLAHSAFYAIVEVHEQLSNPRVELAQQWNTPLRMRARIPRWTIWTPTRAAALSGGCSSRAGITLVP